MEKHTNSGGDKPSSYKVKLMCSYGGKIQSRPHDHQLTYVGGDTKILTVDRNVKFCDIVDKLNSLCNCKTEVCLKYQLSGEDLDTLVSLIDDDDLEHMMVEYDQIHRISTKPARIRLFLFARNRPVKIATEAPFNPDFLFGFDKAYEGNSAPTFEIPQIAGMGVPRDTGSDPVDGVELREQIQSLAGKNLAGEDLSWPRDSHVMSGSYVAPLFYRVLVPAGGYSGLHGVHGMVPGVVNREQPVYTFVPVMPSTEEQKPGVYSDGSTVGAHVESINEAKFRQHGN